VVSGLVLVLSAPEPKQPKSAFVQVTPAIGQGSVGLVVGGAF
jgi:hypothetical protein